MDEPLGHLLMDVKWSSSFPMCGEGALMVCTLPFHLHPCKVISVM